MAKKFSELTAEISNDPVRAARAERARVEALAEVVEYAQRARDYEIVCACGNRWRLQADEEPDTAECVACGADATEITELGDVRPSY